MRSESLGNQGLDRPISKWAYDRYAHVIKTSYGLIGGSSEVDVTPYDEFERDFERSLSLGASSMRTRLEKLDPNLCAELIEFPYLIPMYVGSRSTHIVIANKEGQSWYTTNSVHNFDFLVETFCGLHDNAKVIYDIGGHQGVWAHYYSQLIPAYGRVYTFEPSIINIEIAALNFLLNDITNVVQIPMGVGQDNMSVRSDSNALIVAGAATNMCLIRPDWAMFEKPDFVKIDIEGYEHEFVKAMPQIFETSSNIHLEIHVPHLEQRGVDYKETLRAIPFDKVRVRLARYGNLTEIGPHDELEGFSTLLITPKN